MKFLPIILAITTVVGQQATIYHDKRKTDETRYRKYRCHTDLDNKAWAIKADDDVFVEFYSNSDCKGHWKRRAWGRVTFNDPVDYRSIKLVDRDRNVKVLKIESSDDEDDNDGGSEVHGD